MLDQNTDRMWYVIGAVLVGAAIILIANGTIPEIFANVTGSFNNVLTTATEFEILYSFDKPDGFDESNILNTTSMTYGLHIYNDGRMNDNREWAISDFSEIEAGVEYTFETHDPTVNKKMLFYDENKVLIYGRTTYKTEPIVKSISHTSPNNAFYAKVATVYNNKNRQVGYAPIGQWWLGKTSHNPYN